MPSLTIKANETGDLYYSVYPFQQYYDEHDELLEHPISDLHNAPSVERETTLKIENVIFNGPATIVFWNDGSKTVVKCCEDDKYDPEKGLAMAICKKFLGDEFKSTFKKWIPDKKEDYSAFGKALNDLIKRLEKSARKPNGNE